MVCLQELHFGPHMLTVTVFYTDCLSCLKYPLSIEIFNYSYPTANEKKSPEENFVHRTSTVTEVLDNCVLTQHLKKEWFAFHQTIINTDSACFCCN